MVETFTLVFIVLGIVAVGTVVAGAWVALTVVRLLFRGVFGLLRGAPVSPPPLPTRLSVIGHRCGRSGCQAVNPGSARFCRRCGRELDAGVMRHAAMW